MRKFLIAAAASFLILGGQADASSVENLNEQIEVQEQSGKWAHFRDKHILGRETENERRDRKDWERRHRYDPPPPRRSRDRDYYRDYGPPPPPPPRHGRYYPPPPPNYRDYVPPPPLR